MIEYECDLEEWEELRSAAFLIIMALLGFAAGLIFLGFMLAVYFW